MTRSDHNPEDTRAAMDAAREAFERMGEAFERIGALLRDSASQLVEEFALYHRPDEVETHAVMDALRRMNEPPIDIRMGRFEDLRVRLLRNRIVSNFRQRGGRVTLTNSSAYRYVLIELRYQRWAANYHVAESELALTYDFNDFMVEAIERAIVTFISQLNSQGNVQMGVDFAMPAQADAYIQDVRWNDRPLTHDELEALAAYGPYAPRMSSRFDELKTSKKRSREFLLEHLNDEQRRQMERNDSFALTAPSGRYYEIHPLNTFNVRVMGSNQYPDWSGNACVQAQGNVPVYDQMLMQKLMIETDEDNFIAIANVRGPELSRLQTEIRAKRAAQGGQSSLPDGWEFTPGIWGAYYYGVDRGGNDYTGMINL